MPPPTIPMLVLRISLNGTKPEVWRSILVREDLPLTQVHDRIQGAMGWNDSHLHLFKIGDIEYLDYVLWEDHDTAADENRMTLKKLKLKVGDTFRYVYDMGDNWEHTITVLDTVSVPADRADSWVLNGANACPPEDVGGVHGYEELHGTDFDVTQFDIQSARRILFLLDYFGKGYPWTNR